MTALMKRVKSHVTGQATSGQNTLSLTLDCIEHMRDNQNEWSALAYLIGKAQPAQSRIVRKIAGQVLQGWRIAKDDDQPSGLRFSKVKGTNQGYDEDRLVSLKSLIEVKASIQSKSVVDTFTPEKAAPKPVSVEKAAEHVVKYLKGKEGLSTGEVLTLVQQMLTAQVVTGEPSI